MRRIGRVCSIIGSLAFCGISPTAVAADKVVMGVIQSLSDAPFFLAIDKGYFAEAGIEPRLEEIPVPGEADRPLELRRPRRRIGRHVGRPL
jgi:hypothetical protein